MPKWHICALLMLAGVGAAVVVGWFSMFLHGCFVEWRQYYYCAGCAKMKKLAKERPACPNCYAIKRKQAGETW